MVRQTVPPRETAYAATVCVHVRAGAVCVHVRPATVCVHVCAGAVCVHVRPATVCVHVCAGAVCVHVRPGAVCVCVRACTVCVHVHAGTACVRVHARKCVCVYACVCWVKERLYGRMNVFSMHVWETARAVYVLSMCMFVCAGCKHNSPSVFHFMFILKQATRVGWMFLGFLPKHFSRLPTSLKVFPA